jgi:hypothetical protein
MHKAQAVIGQRGNEELRDEFIAELTPYVDKRNENAKANGIISVYSLTYEPNPMFPGTFNIILVVENENMPRNPYMDAMAIFSDAWQSEVYDRKKRAQG